MKALMIIKYMAERVYEVLRVILGLQIMIWLWRGDTHEQVFIGILILIFTQLVEINTSVRSSKQITAMSISGEDMIKMMKGDNEDEE